MSTGPRRTSDILQALALGPSDRISVRQIVSALGERTYALLIVVLGLPNCLPMPPPIPLISGILLFFIALQLAVGWPSPWLPKRMLDHTIARDVVAKAATRAVPYLVWLERVARPRLGVFESEVAIRFMGVALLAFSLALVTAAPVIGQIPLGLAVCLVGLGLVERDGYVVVGGLAVGMVGTSLSLGFVFAVIASATAIF